MNYWMDVFKHNESAIFLGVIEDHNIEADIVIVDELMLGRISYS